MQTSTDRILTTHTGSIARPDDLISIMRERENGRPYDEDAFARPSRRRPSRNACDASVQPASTS